MPIDLIPVLPVICGGVWLGAQLHLVQGAQHLENLGWYFLLNGAYALAAILHLYPQVIELLLEAPLGLADFDQLVEVLQPL